MKIKEKQLKRMKWTARITALLILLFAFPFYIGYGNPLPFTNPENNLLDNVWLIVFPIMFIGLAIGWKWEKIAGYLLIAPILIAAIIGLVLQREFIPGPMYFPLAIGILYLVVGYKKK